jgi:RNA polymerase sigma-54 factor
VERILKIIQALEPPECEAGDVERVLKIVQTLKPLECEVENVEQILQLIQTFDPAGVGARNLEECLLIQLEQIGLADTVAYRIVEEDYLQDLEANRFPQIAKSLKVDMELVRAAADAISCLEPRPGRLYSSVKTEIIFPDVTVEESDGEYRIFMNDSGPNLRLSPLYRRMLRSRDSLSSEERDYIRSNMNSARWLIESIESRRITILRVTESIFEVQREFLDKGPTYLKPLTLKEIADRVGVHESTVSRVTRNRYVQTPRGVFELKYFFTSSISTEGGGARSSLSVKETIKDMVDKEDPQNPLSDKDIELQLKQNGLKIARRTIAKYRGELNIPNSSKRKKW